MSDTRSLTPSEREELVAYLDNETDPATSERLQSLLERNPHARREKELLQESWQLLDVLDRPAAPRDFKDRTASMARLPAQDPSPPSSTGSFGRVAWIASAAVGFVIGAAAVWSLPDANKQLLRDLPILERYEQYRLCQEIEFVKQLQKSEVFHKIQAQHDGGSGS
jgi:anti-sigma factor RsiW